MNSKLLISNRSLIVDYTDALPKRIHIVPRGELPNAEAGIVQVLDEKAINSILKNLRDKQAKHGGLYLGEEHFIYNSDRSSEAFAWAKEFEADAQGIWALNPEYTDVGAPAIQNKRFKWTSFVTDPAVPGSVEKLGGNKVRILAIDTVGFTNFANGKSLLAPVTNRNDLAGAGATAASQQQQQRTHTMKSIAQKLGLAAEASEEAILTEVTKLQNRVTQLEPLDATNTTLKNRVTELEGEQCDNLLELYGVKEEKARETLKPMLGALKNRAERVTALTNLGHKLPEATKAATARVLNRNASPATPPAETAENADDQVKADKIRNRANQLVAGGMKFEQAWNMARTES